jgi:hypothetical protein
MRWDIKTPPPSPGGLAHHQAIPIPRQALRLFKHQVQVLLCSLISIKKLCTFLLVLFVESVLNCEIVYNDTLFRFVMQDRRASWPSDSAKI